MRYRFASLALPAVVILCASCASSRERFEPLKARRDVPVTFTATLAPRAGETNRHTPDPAAAAPHALQVPPRVDAPAIEVTCRLVRIQTQALSEILPEERRSAYGLVMSKHDVEALAPALHAAECVEMISSPQLLLGENKKGELRIASQQSFVRGFGLQLVAGNLIGDPDIATVSEGFTLRVTGKPGATANDVELELAIDDTELMKPLRESSVALPGTRESVTVQMPITFEQHLGANSTLAPDEMLILGGLIDREGQPFLACVTSRRVPAGGAGNVSSIVDSHGTLARR